MVGIAPFVTLAELVRVWERRLDDCLPGQLAPLDGICRRMLQELSELEPGSVAPAYLSTRQVASRLGVSSKTVAHYCSAGKLPGARKTGDQKGGRWIVPASAVLAFIRSRE